MALELDGIRKRYGSLVVLDGLSLRVVPGEIVGLLGPNGAGKTTSLRIICGLLRADGGSGHCLGTPLGRTAPGLGYVPQRGGLYDDLSVGENLLFLARAQGLGHPRAAVAATIAEHGLEGRVGQRIAQLSGGWRQRVALAAALLHAPRLLLLDEPTAGLDHEARESLWQRLRRLAADGTAVLLSTHHAEEAERCDRIGWLAGGGLRAEGRPDRIGDSLGLIVCRASSEPTPHPQQLAIRDAAGWRVIGPVGLADSAQEAARLGDALAWLASRSGAAS
ncbi:ABC transporter ATP-binding protein [Nevskia sp.]|uniref:ABC transporter ATP-binding protein n=1 Tax=Nevskia sp. TaxID=1929292 RepID=UPI0025EEF03B|nr:ABC transporter ATP-binding protein [Nevskia sp.]